MGKEPSSHSNVDYVIDETVVLEGEERAYNVWNLKHDSSKNDKYILKAISRNGTPVRSYLLPEEELHHFTAGDEIWWEHRGEPGVKLDETFEVTERDSKPFVHEGNYVLILSADAPDKTPKVTLKLREVEK